MFCTVLPSAVNVIFTVHCDVNHGLRVLTYTVTSTTIVTAGSVPPKSAIFDKDAVMPSLVWLSLGNGSLFDIVFCPFTAL